MYFSIGLITAGILVLVSALFPLCRLITMLPAGGLRRCWSAVALLVLVFIGGYIATAVVAEPGLLIAAVYFLGSVFVFAVAVLAQYVAHYAKRIVVLEEENITDPLMHIYNRRYLNRRVKKEFLRSQKLGRPLSVLILDVDHFKQVNDRYGHLSGDAVLRQLGPVVRKCVRQSDVVARYGGEEIMVLSRDTSNGVASALAQRVCSEVSANKFYSATEGSGELRQIQITVSVGVATLNKHDNVARLIHRADEALYQAKRDGRNRVRVSELLQQSAPAAEATIRAKRSSISTASQTTV